MKRFPALLLVATLLLFSLAACRRPIIHGSGKTATENRTVSGSFAKIEIDAPVDAAIELVPGSTPSISLSGYANVLPYIKLKMENGKLKIYTEDGVRLYTPKHINAHITLPSLEALEIAGSSDTKVTGNVTGNELKIDIAGSGSVNIASLNVTLLDVDMAGAAEIEVMSGNTTTASYEIAGSGDIRAFNLQTTDTDIEIAGSGDAQVNASGKLDVSISGSGDVQYKGTPVVSKDITGSGSVEMIQ